MQYASILFALSILICVPAEGQQMVKRLGAPTAPIAQGVWAGDTLYLSGMTAAPVNADAPKGTPPVFGDTKAQTGSTMMRIQSALESQGLKMGDVVMMHVYLVGDPAKEGKMDFAGMMEAYSEYFGSKDQPNKPARTTVQVAALVNSALLVEIETIAVRSK
jgi:enamine deaminase RidA (YjgF/YER057c/UK114 family)